MYRYTSKFELYTQKNYCQLFFANELIEGIKNSEKRNHIDHVEHQPTMLVTHNSVQPVASVIWRYCGLASYRSTVNCFASVCKALMVANE